MNPAETAVVHSVWAAYGSVNQYFGGGGGGGCGGDNGVL